MAQQIISVGTLANDGTGDPLRTAMIKVNENFTEIYSRDAVGSNLDITANTITSTNTNGNIELQPNAAGQVIIAKNNVIIQTSKTPSSSVGAAGDLAGMIAWDNTHIYVCTANYDGSTNIWARAAISTW
jgi:hypothetical protein